MTLYKYILSYWNEEKKKGFTWKPMWEWNVLFTLCKVKFSLISVYNMYSSFAQTSISDRKRLQRAFWSSLSFQFRQRIKLWNQSPVWSDLLTVGIGCWLIDIRTESPRESCCLLFPSKETHALLLASSGICQIQQC